MISKNRVFLMFSFSRSGMDLENKNPFQTLVRFKLFSEPLQAEGCWVHCSKMSERLESVLSGSTSISIER